MKLSEFIPQYRDLFDARTDVYAVGYPDAQTAKYRYRREDAALTDQVVRQHLLGELMLGVYALREDSTCQWAAIDFDGAKGVEPAVAFQQAYEEALAQQRAFLGAGLFSYIERSRSGAGAHLWLFFDAPIPAATIRRALWPLLVDATTLDRMFPVQDELTADKPYGNLIALPFHRPAVDVGNSIFIEADGSPISPLDFLARVKRNAAVLIEDLAAKAPRRTPTGTRVSSGGAPAPEDAEQLTGALKVVSGYGCSFVRHCLEKRVGLSEPLWYAGIQCATYYRNGRDLAHLLSMGDPRYDVGTVDAKYDQALRNPRIGCQWIHENYPQLACKSCPMKAPHYLAEKSILELVGGKGAPMRRVGSFGKDLERVQALEAGHLTTGQPWGLEGLDDISRARRSEYVAIGAMSSIGKTWMMLQLMYRLAKQGVVVYCFSAETGEISLRTRLLAHVSGIDSRALNGEREEKLTKAEWERLFAASDELDQLPIFIDYTSLSADQVLAQVEEVQLTQRIDFDQPAVIFFDYLQFGSKIQGETTDYDKVSRLSTEFKFVAKITNQTMVVLSQVRRDKEGAEHPDLTWFKNTGRIENDIDVGLIMTGQRIVGSHAPRELWIVKQREGVANARLPFLLDQTCGRWEYRP